MVWVNCRGGNSDHVVWVSFSLQIFTVLLNSGGSNSQWSEFWSEFPHFMGMGVVPAPSNITLGGRGLLFWGGCKWGCIISNSQIQKWIWRRFLLNPLLCVCVSRKKSLCYWKTFSVPKTNAFRKGRGVGEHYSGNSPYSWALLNFLSDSCLLNLRNSTRARLQSFSTVTLRIITFLVQKHFKTATVTVILEN